MFVGKSNLDPQQEENQLICRDGIGGAILAQPIIVQNGITKNTDGQTVVVVIEAQQYSVRYLNLNGRVIDELSSDKLIGDALSDGGGSGGGIPDRTFNNFTQALNDNLDGINFIYIKSQSTGWEGTAEGPTITEFYFYTGGTGPASTGDTENYTFFYDANGNEFKKVTDSALSDLDARVATNETDIAQNTSDIAQNTSDIAQNSSDIAAIPSQLAPLIAVNATETESSTGISQVLTLTGSSEYDLDFIIVSDCSSTGAGFRTDYRILISANSQNIELLGVAYRIDGISQAISQNTNSDILLQARGSIQDISENSYVVKAKMTVQPSDIVTIDASHSVTSGTPDINSQGIYLKAVRVS